MLERYHVENEFSDKKFKSEDEEVLGKKVGSKRRKTDSELHDEDRESTSFTESKTRKSNNSSLSELIRESFDYPISSKSHFHTAVASVLRMSFLMQNMSSNVRCRFYSNKILLNRSRRPRFKSKEGLQDNHAGNSRQEAINASDLGPDDTRKVSEVRYILLNNEKSLASAIILARREHGKQLIDSSHSGNMEMSYPIARSTVSIDERSVETSCSPATATTIDELDVSIDTGSDGFIDDSVSMSEGGECSDVDADSEGIRTRPPNLPTTGCDGTYLEESGNPASLVPLTCKNFSPCYEYQQYDLPSSNLAKQLEALFSKSKTSEQQKTKPISRALDVAAPPKLLLEHPYQNELELLAGVQLLRSLRAM